MPQVFFACDFREVSSVGLERLLHTQEVEGSNPLLPTIKALGVLLGAFLLFKGTAWGTPRSELVGLYNLYKAKPYLSPFEDNAKAATATATGNIRSPAEAAGKPSVNGDVCHRLQTGKAPARRSGLFLFEWLISASLQCVG